MTPPPSTVHPGDEPLQLADAIALHRAALLGFVRRRLDGAVEAEDVVAQALARAWERRGSLRDHGSARAWLFAVTRSTLRDHVRASSVRQRHAAAVQAVVEVAAEVAPERCGCSIALMASLAPRYAEVLRLVDVEGATLAEAARALGVTVNNATVRLSRARKALRDRLEAHCGTRSAAECLRCPCGERDCCA